MLKGRSKMLGILFLCDVTPSLCRGIGRISVGHGHRVIRAKSGTYDSGECGDTLERKLFTTVAFDLNIALSSR